MIERDVEDYLVKRVKALGGECRKVVWPGRRGAPDRLVMLPGFALKPQAEAAARDPAVIAWLQEAQQRVSAALPGSGYCVWVELKAPGQKAKPHQVREHERMRNMGQRVEVVDSIEGVDALLQ